METIDQTLTPVEQAWCHHLHHREQVVDQVLSGFPGAQRAEVERLYELALRTEGGPADMRPTAASPAPRGGTLRSAPARPTRPWQTQWGLGLAMAGMALAALGLLDRVAEAGIKAQPAAILVGSAE